jgi:hypothetical protein
MAEKDDYSWQEERRGKGHELPAKFQPLKHPMKKFEKFKINYAVMLGKKCHFLVVVYNN